ncbi:hypothetical protein EDC94DRAFT_670997 [Helicostylum pulchrum]|nr:hypothetical protein EDC94DRAFT_670997 [Helicostylum pulchrum]
MEWSISPTYDTHTDYICGRKRYGMGLQLENPPRPWILGRTGSSPIHQLEGTQGGPSSTDDFPVPQNSTILIRTDNTTSLSYINKQGGTRSLPLMELVPGQQYTYPSTQHCGHGITSKFFQEPMAIETEGFPNDQPLVGPAFNRPLRRQDHQVTTKVRIWMPDPALSTRMHSPFHGTSGRDLSQIHLGISSHGLYGRYSDPQNCFNVETVSLYHRFTRDKNKITIYMFVFI